MGGRSALGPTPDPAGEPRFNGRADVDRHRANIGRRIRWRDEVIGGTITDVVPGNWGWPLFVVAWDEEAPVTWPPHVSCSSGSSVVIDDA